MMALHVVSGSTEYLISWEFLFLHESHKECSKEPISPENRYMDSSCLKKRSYLRKDDDLVRSQYDQCKMKILSMRELVSGGHGGGNRTIDSLISKM